LKTTNFLGLVALLVFGLGSSPVMAQSQAASKELSESRAKLLESNQNYRTTSEALKKLQQEEIDKAKQKLEELRQLVAEGLVARVELEQAERNVAALQQKLVATDRQITDSDKIAAEIRTEQQLEKSQLLVPKSMNNPNVSRTVLRYSGVGGWSLNNLDSVRSFFLSKFGRILPTSAIGQSATHNQLGWDHRNAVDISVHPDSAEGKALIAYLQSQGIPFLAFRWAIPGVATGPHIHIGLPSHRLS
jgi:multidrug efflux pump subunit AcrA (membrane-fusion protein)